MHPVRKGSPVSSRSERPKNRIVKLVGGGERRTRSATKSGGGLKATRRALRRQIKEKKETPATRRALKERLAALLAQKDGRP